MLKWFSVVFVAVVIIISSLVAPKRIRYRGLTKLGINPDIPLWKLNLSLSRPDCVWKTWYGAPRHKHIISMSLWGSGKVYREGAIRNVHECNKYLARWKCRFYIPKDLWEKEDIGKHLVNLGADVVVMNIDKPFANEGSIWRFYSSTAPPEFNGQLMVSRDVDDFINKDVADWLDRWESSKKIFTRQESWDTILPILFTLKAGRWGAMVGRNSNGFGNLIVASNMYKHRGSFGFDEVFLEDEVWPVMKDNPSKVFVYKMNLQQVLASRDNSDGHTI